MKLLYLANPVLISQIIKESDYLINKYENEIDCLNSEIDVLVQIYLKSRMDQMQSRDKDMAI